MPTLLEMKDIDTITDALIAAQKRGALPTRMTTAELRELGAGILARSVFSARATNAIFVDALKKLIERLAAGELGEGQVRTALWEVLELLGYDSERGGFPEEELEPELAGTLQDLKSFRRRDLIVRTQLDLMQSAGLKLRGEDPDMLSEFPAWELVRLEERVEKRDWQSRWDIAGGKWINDEVIARLQKENDEAHHKLSIQREEEIALIPEDRRNYSNPEFFEFEMRWAGIWASFPIRPHKRQRMIALKGDPFWGELGSSQNFSDALDTDHPIFAWNSGMGWREVSREEVELLGITGPDGEPWEEFFASQPVTLTGKQALPTPQVSLQGVDPAIIERFKARVEAETGGKPYVFDFSENLTRSLKAAEEAYKTQDGKTQDAREEGEES